MRITANPDRSVAIRVLRRAVELGVNHLDTAAFYATPGGTLGISDKAPTRYANELIREALSPYPEDLVITTKVGPGVDPERGFYNATTAAELRTQVEENLRQLGRDHLDVVNLRVADGSGSLAERFGWLAELRDSRPDPADGDLQRPPRPPRRSRTDRPGGLRPEQLLPRHPPLRGHLPPHLRGPRSRLRPLLRNQPAHPADGAPRPPRRPQYRHSPRPTTPPPSRSAWPGPSTDPPTSWPSPAPAIRPTWKKTSPQAP